jgi:hypothetical protein
MEIAARQTTLGNLCGGHAEKQHHEQFVGDEMEAEFPKQRCMIKMMVSFRSQIRPDQGDHNPGKKRDGKFP